MAGRLHPDLAVKVHKAGGRILSYGNPQPVWDDKEYLAAFDRVLEAAKKAGKPAGMFAVSDNILWAKQKGFVLNTVDDADAFLKKGASLAVEKFRKG